MSEKSDEPSSEYDISGISESEIDAAIAKELSDTDPDIDERHVSDSILIEQKSCPIEETQISENQLSQHQVSLFSFRAPEQNQDCSDIPEETPELYKRHKVSSRNQNDRDTFRETSVITLNPKRVKKELTSNRNTTYVGDRTVEVSNIINHKESKVKRKYMKCSSKGCQTNIKRWTNSVACQTAEILIRPLTCMIDKFTQTTLFNTDNIEYDPGQEVVNVYNDNELGSDFSQSEVKKEIIYSRPIANMRDYVRGKSSYNFSEREEEIADCSILLQNDNKTRFEEREKHKKSNPSIDTEIKQSMWQKGATKDFPNCADIKLFNNYYILSIDGRIEKRPRIIGDIEKIPLPGAGRLCSIKDSNSSCLAVIQTGKGIVCFQTNPQLSILYRIQTLRQYLSICHIETSDIGLWIGRPNPSHTFIATLTERKFSKESWAESIVTVQAKNDKSIRDRNEYQERQRSKIITPYNEEACLVPKLKEITGISSIESVWEEKERFIIIGCHNQVVCVRYEDMSIMWKFRLDRAATDVGYMRPNVLVCVQDRLKIISLNLKHGTIINENILTATPDKDKKPHKLSVYGNRFLLKCYTGVNWAEPLIVEYNQSDEFTMMRREKKL